MATDTIKVEAFGKVWLVPAHTKWLTLDTVYGYDVNALFTKRKPQFRVYNAGHDNEEHFLGGEFTEEAVHIGKLTEEEHRTWLNTL